MILLQHTRRCCFFPHQDEILKVHGKVKLPYVNTSKKGLKYWFKNYVELHPWLNHIIPSSEKESLSPISQQKYKQLLPLQGYKISEFHYSYKNTQRHSYYFTLKCCQGNIVTIFTQVFTRQNSSLWLFLSLLKIWETKFYLQKGSCHVKFRLVQLLQGIYGMATKLQQGSCNHLMFVFTHN